MSQATRRGPARQRARLHHPLETDTFGTCDFINPCGPGSVCTDSDLSPDSDPTQQSCCLPYCDLAAPDPCPGLDLAGLAWCDADESPPGLADNGVCGLEP